MDLRGLKGRVSQWTGKLVDQILDQQQSSGQGPPPPPRPQQGPSPPYDTHPQYGSGYPQYGVNSQYQYGANPQYGVMPQYNQAPQYPQYPQYGQVGFQNNGQPPAFIPPRPPSPPDALHVRFKAAPTQNAQPWSNTTFRATAYSGPPRPFPPDPKVAKVDFLGDVHSSNTYVIRDLGFQGRLGDHILLSYGDTLFSDANYSDTWRGIASDSIALATHDPLVVIDPILDDNGYPPQFCPIHKQYGEDNSECALGITNVVETSHNQGILFFLLNHRPGGVSRIVGAGVATVHLDTRSYPPKPHINRLPPQTWWDGDTEPWWGDVGALRWGEHIYAYGHGADKDTNPWVYVTRVKYYEATNINCYEYWNGDTWQKERLKVKDLGEKGSVFWQINQGTVVWSNYFHCFIFVYSDNWCNSRVLMKWSQLPEGPWSEPITLYQATPLHEGGTTYAASPHPYFDESGKTLVCTFTNHPNVVQAIRVTFA